MSITPYPQTRVRRIKGLPVSPSTEAIRLIIDDILTLPVGSHVTLFGAFDGAIPAAFASEAKGYTMEIVCAKPSDTLKWVVDRHPTVLQLVKTPVGNPMLVIIDSALEGTAVNDAVTTLKLKPVRIILHNARPRLAGNTAGLVTGPLAAALLGQSSDYTNRLTYTLTAEGGRRGLLWLSAKATQAAVVPIEPIEPPAKSRETEEIPEVDEEIPEVDEEIPEVERPDEDPEVELDDEDPEVELDDEDPDFPPMLDAPEQSGPLPLPDESKVEDLPKPKAPRKQAPKKEAKEKKTSSKRSKKKAE